jgi:hypothetical protein
MTLRYITDLLAKARKGMPHGPMPLPTT